MGSFKRLGRVDLRRHLLEAFAMKLSKEDAVVVEATGNAASVAAVIAPHVKKGRDGVVSTRIHASGCARDIPGARLTILNGVGHSLHHTAADRVVEIVLEAERRASAQAPEAA